MSIEEDFLTVLTPDGEFLRARRQENIEIGEELSFFPVSLPDTTRRTVWKSAKTKRNAISIISTLAAMILIITFIPMFATSKQVYAYVSIDINPSLELGVDHELQVLSITPLNEDAEKLLNELPEWKNKHIDEVTELIIDGSVDKGYLEQGEEVLVTTVVTESEDNKENEILLQTDLEEISKTYSKESNIVVKTIQSNIETREKAKQEGLSTGKLVQKQKQEHEKEQEAIQQEEEKGLEEADKTNNNENDEVESNSPTNNAGKKDDTQAKEEISEDQNSKKPQENKNGKVNNNKGQNNHNKEKPKNSSILENEKVPNHVKEKLKDKFKSVPNGWNREEKGKENKNRE